MSVQRRNPFLYLSLTLLFGFLPGFSGVGEAASYSFTSGPTSGTNFGNSVQRSSGGIDVTVTGWSLSDLAGSFHTGRIKIWSTGMGVCNQGEGLNCSNPQHPVDNYGYTDFLLFSFSQTVLLDEAELTAWKSDFDATLWAGTGSLILSGGQTLADLNGPGIEDLFGGNNATPGGTARTLDLENSFSTPVNWFLIGASVSNQDYVADSFKFKSLTVGVPSSSSEVPEPTTIVLFGTGLTGIFAARRFMKRSSV